MRKIFLLISMLFVVFFFLGLQNKKGWDIKKIKDSLEEDGFYCISDTLMDVDGDGIQDLIINARTSIMYPLHSFVYRGNLMKHTREFVFINPTYSIEESIVRCVYGDCELYDDSFGGYIVLEKYKWTHIGVDTLEQYFIRSIPTTENHPYYKDYEKISKEQIPDEYKNIHGFDSYYNNINE